MFPFLHVRRNVDTYASVTFVGKASYREDVLYCVFKHPYHGKGVIVLTFIGLNTFCRWLSQNASAKC